MNEKFKTFMNDSTINYEGNYFEYNFVYDIALWLKWFKIYIKIYGKN